MGGCARTRLCLCAHLSLPLPGVCMCVYIYIYIAVCVYDYRKMKHSGTLCSTLRLVCTLVVICSLCCLGKLKSSLGMNQIRQVSECNEWHACTNSMTVHILQLKRGLNTLVSLYQRNSVRSVTGCLLPLPLTITADSLPLLLHIWVILGSNLSHISYPDVSLVLLSPYRIVP